MYEYNEKIWYTCTYILLTIYICATALVNTYVMVKILSLANDSLSRYVFTFSKAYLKNRFCRNTYKRSRYVKNFSNYD